MILGVWSPTEVSVKHNAINDLLRDLALEYKVPFIDLINRRTYDHNGNLLTDIGSPLIYGTGKVGSPVYDGNADVCTSADGAHPSPEGHLLLGDYIGSELIKIFNVYYAIAI